MGLFDWANTPPKKKTPAKMDAKVKTYQQRMDEAIDGPAPVMRQNITKTTAVKKKPGY